MRVIGLTGGVGAGKSRILNLLEEKYHAKILQADQVAHKLMEPGMEGNKALAEAFGESILKQDGSIDRPVFAALLFGNDRIRQKVDEIIHPMVWKYIENEISASQAALIVVESAIMDHERDDMYDEMWYVYTSEENRISRLMENRGYTKEKSEQIMKSQPSDEEFRKMADRVIDNNGTMEELETQLESIVRNRGL